LNSGKVLTRSLIDSAVRLPSFNNSEYDSDDLGKNDSFDYEFSNLVLIGTSDKNSNLYVQSLTKLSDNNKSFMIKEFDSLYKTVFDSNSNRNLNNSIINSNRINNN